MARAKLARLAGLATRAASILTLTLLGTGCVSSYASRPALEYADVEYSSPQGTDWPESRLALPETAKKYRLPNVPEITYVEQNRDAAPTVVMIHGLGSYLKFWRYQVDEVAKAGYHVIALDMLGYGKSDKPATFPYTMEAMSQVVHELVKAKGLQHPILMGHSMGGQTALSYAIQFPEDLGGLVLVSPAGFESFSPKEKQWFRNVFSSKLILAADEEAIWGSIRYGNFYRWESAYEWLIEERVRAVKNSQFKAYAYANVKSVHGLLDNEFVRSNLKRIHVPTLIVHGDRDRLIPNPFLHGGNTVDIMEYGHANIAGSKLVTLSGCGHSLQLDCHDEFNRAALEFLKANFPAGTREVSAAPPAAPAVEPEAPPLAPPPAAAEPDSEPKEPAPEEPAEELPGDPRVD